MFERLIRCTKRCLKKMIGRASASLTYDELSTLTTEVEAVLNSRPLTYVDSDDLKGPLTPSHLSLPDPGVSDLNDPDYKESSTDLSRIMKYFIKISEQLWKRWRTEYLQELRKFHRH